MSDGAWIDLSIKEFSQLRVAYYDVLITAWNYPGSPKSQKFKMPAGEFGLGVGSSKLQRSCIMNSNVQTFKLSNFKFNFQSSRRLEGNSVGKR
jgi:hypothetical protein